MKALYNSVENIENSISSHKIKTTGSLKHRVKRKNQKLPLVKHESARNLNGILKNKSSNLEQLPIEINQESN